MTVLRCCRYSQEGSRRAHQSGRDACGLWWRGNLRCGNFLFRLPLLERQQLFWELCSRAVFSPNSADSIGKPVSSDVTTSTNAVASISSQVGTEVGTLGGFGEIWRLRI